MKCCNICISFQHKNALKDANPHPQGMWKQKSWNQHKFALGMLYHTCFFTVRNILFPCRRAMLWKQRGENDPARIQELSPGKKWLLQLLQWTLLFTGSLRGRKYPALGFGQEDCGGRIASPSLLWCLAQREILDSWVGFWLAGEVLRIVTQIVHGDKNGVWELLFA